MAKSSLRCYLMVLVYALKLNIRKLLTFRTSFVLDLLSSLTYTAILIIFWSIVYTNQPLPGWSLGQTFAFLAFVELFYALSMSFFVATGKIWVYINSGRLDLYLIRPLDPRFVMCVLNIRIENLLRALPGIALLGYLSAFHGASLPAGSVIRAVLICGVAAWIYANLQLAASWLSFWLGRSQMIDEFTDSLIEFNRYPHTIFPGWMRFILITILPLGLAATVPAHELFRFHLYPYVWIIIGGTLIGWSLLQTFLWSRGNLYYESYNG